jgi:GTP cyclohydrolase I
VQRPWGAKGSKHPAVAVLCDAVHVCKSQQGLREANHRQGRHVVQAEKEGSQVNRSGPPMQGRYKN